MKIAGDKNENREYDLDILKKYVSGTLQEKESQKVLKDIEASDTLKTIVAGLEHAYNDSEKKFDNLDQFLSDTLSKQERQIHQKKKNTNDNRTILLAAASITIILGFSWLYLSLFETSSTADEIVAQHISEVYPIRSHTVRGSVTTIEEWKQYYANQDYKKAEALLEKISVKNEEEYFYLGMTNLFEKDFAMSKVYLNKVLSKGVKNGFEQNARWYLALIYYKSGNLETTLRFLEKISSTPNHFKTEEAKILMTAIE